MKDYTYIGDGVYVRRDDFGQVEICTSDGIGINNQIFLDTETLESFFLWAGKGSAFREEDSPDFHW